MIVSNLCQWIQYTCGLSTTIKQDTIDVLLHIDQVTLKIFPKVEVCAETQTSQESDVTGLAGENLGRHLNAPQRQFCLLFSCFYRHL